MKILILCFVAGCGAQSSVNGDATAALRDNDELFRHILTSNGGDADETLAPGQPLDVYMVQLDELSVFDGKSAITPLFHDLSQRLFPLHGHKGALTSMTLSKSGRLVRAGAENLTKSVVAARATLAPAARELGLVRIPGLHIDFLASYAGSELWLTPLYDQQLLGLHARAAQSAPSLLAQLAPAAQKALSEDRM